MNDVGRTDRMRKKSVVTLAAQMMLGVGLLGFLHLFMAWMMWDVPALRMSGMEG
jgi:hypothetical protein